MRTRKQAIAMPPRAKTDFSFANATEWLEHCEGPSDMALSDRVSMNAGDVAFRGTSSFEEALDLARKGWSEGVEEVRKIAADVVEASHSRAYQKTFRPNRVGGGTLLMGRFLQNLPECYLKLQKTETNRFVTIVVNGTSSCTVDKEILTRRGATAAAIVETLEQQRVRVRVELVFCYSGRKTGAARTWRIVLKDFNESLDIDRLAFFLANPSSERRVLRAAAERLTKFDRADLGIPGGYGIPIDITEGRGDIYIPAAKSSGEWSSIESCAEFLRQTLRSQGVEISC